VPPLQERTDPGQPKEVEGRWVDFSEKRVG
jgi:hypothetical protein